MDDPIPAGFITLPEALQRIATCVSDAHLEGANIDLPGGVRLVAANGRDELQTASTNNEPQQQESPNFRSPSEQALRQWNGREFAVGKLRAALQKGAISAMVRAPESGSLFRLTQSDWHFEPFWEQILRGGVIPRHAGRGLECHRGRTVLVETTRFEEWLAMEVSAWPEASGLDLARQWLIREMTASPNDKKMTKARWYEAAKAKFPLSRREFDIAWSDALKVTGANWGQPGAPHKSSQ
ncbi:hypothetical protein [Bradyrhizobium sp. CCBAU 051011]|uniref:hypothetical protein n=1 Tax=Bradyrhizobium sp. CCBAU 051011 TaxID=858422 RepID=UPI00137A831B|nr:hypothetical protein [Bradyrhizobium sp. CCBAU 051011]